MRVLCHWNLNHLATPSAPTVAEFASDQQSSVSRMERTMIEHHATEFLFQQTKGLRETPNHAILFHFWPLLSRAFAARQRIPLFERLTRRALSAYSVRLVSAWEIAD